MDNGKCRAVIIDDEAWIREGLCEHIRWEKLGIELAAVFRDGMEAFSRLEEDPVEILLSDIRMPNMTGLELVARLRESAKRNENRALSRTKVIFLSGYDDFKYAQEAIRLGAVDYLLKPTEVEEIEEALLRAKNLWNRERRMTVAPDAGEQPEEPGSYLIRKALNYIREHYAEDIQLTKLANELFVSPNYLSRLFRQETGLSFVDHLSRVRLEKACDLLREGVLKIYQVGEAVGYPNPRYFSEWFQKNTGMTPGEYRNRHS